MRPPTRVVVDHVLQALEGEAGGDVVPAVVQPGDAVVLHAAVLHRQRIHTCRQPTFLPLRHLKPHSQTPRWHLQPNGEPFSAFPPLSLALSRTMKEPTRFPGRPSSSSAFCLSTPSNSQLERYRKRGSPWSWSPRKHKWEGGAAPTRGRLWRRGWRGCSSPARCGLSGPSTSRPLCPPERGIVFLRKLVWL